MHCQSLHLAGPAGATLLALHRAQPSRYPALLESAASGGAQGRYSMLLAAPGERLLRRPDGSVQGPGRGPGFLARFEDWWTREATTDAPADRPFSGGWFVLLGYELAGEIEPTLSLPPSPLPTCSLAWRMHAAIVHDHDRNDTVVLAEVGHAAIASDVLRDLDALPGAATPRGRGGPVAVREEPEQRYLDAVARALEYIAAGDIYQANLSRRWTARLPAGLTAADLYARLRRTNPGPFAGLADLGEFAIVSSSPERLVRVAGRRVETRPIAGTRPRLNAGDEPAIRELIGHPKERAEHIMLIDLERNDLGRLCEPGTVVADELMSVESYAHVHHIVSNVRGELRADVTPAAVIRALFPGGTITGCPKVRCMQVIAELEGEGRGPYTGSMGYVNRNGDLDLNILIRSFTVRDGVAELRAGAGIVADSDPARELEETRAKARGVLRALEDPA